MLKRILSLILLATTGLALCACPGGAPVTPPPSNPCPNCGKDPCECPEESEKCPTCGQYPCQCEIDETVVYGDGATMAGTGDKISDRSPILNQAEYDESTAIELPAARFFRQIAFDGKVYRATNDVPVPLADTDDKVYTGKNTVIFLKVRSSQPVITKPLGRIMTVFLPV